MSTDAGEVLSAVLGLPGVSTADVEPDESGGLFALRVELAPGADGRLVADAVNRALHEQLGDGTALPSVHLVGDAPAVPPQPGIRPTLLRSDLVTTGLDFSMTVVLASRAGSATGEARGLATRSAILRGAATATLRAVERLLRDQARFELEHVETTRAGGQTTVLVAVTLLSDRGAEHLTGTATVRDDDTRAAVRATLDALNRRIEHLLA